MGREIEFFREISMKNKTYSKKQLILLLKKWAQEHGQIPNKRLVNSDISMPSDMAYRCAFGSWGKALVAAGFTPTKFMPPGKPKGIRNKFRHRVENGRGYIEIFEPNHPLANKSGYVLEHRMIAWDCGLIKDRKMVVHHKNGLKKDNRIENLEAITNENHTRNHWKGVKRAESGKPCKFCPIKTRSKYGLCRKHYKMEWQRGNIYSTPELLEAKE